jgi:probable phosphomutase (TIGR03848 family)
VTTVILIRHAHSIANEKGVLAGRSQGITLSKSGTRQAVELKKRLGNLKFGQIRISPLERCFATIEPWLIATDVSEDAVIVDQGFTEVDYGDWTGKKLMALSLKKEWRIVQKTPSQMIFPNGEGLLEVQARAKKSLMESTKKAGNGLVLVVSHGDVIKSLIATALDLDLDKFQKIVIDPASISVLDYSKGNFRLLHLNDSTSNFEHLAKSKRSSKTQVGGGSGRK